MIRRHRIFIAINLPEDIRKALAKFQEKWLELPAKWTQKDQLHITLEFLGDLTDEEIAAVCKIAKKISAKHESFSVNLEKIVYGPKDKIPPRMVWAKGEKSEELKDLKEDLEKPLKEEINFKPEARGFAPHITLARIKEWEWKRIEPEDRPEINEKLNLIFTVESLEVMESELRRGGPVCTILESCAFKI